MGQEPSRASQDSNPSLLSCHSKMQTNTQSVEECSELLPLSSSLSTAVMLLTPADQKPKPTFKSKPHTSPPSVSDQKKRKSKSRWLKLKSTVQAAHAITQPHNHRRQQKGGSGGQPLSREDSFLKRFSTRHAAGSGGAYTPSVSQEARRDSCTDDTDNEAECLNDLQNESGLFVVNPDENFMFYWLTVTTVSVLYNLWTSIAREAFPEIGAGYVEVWMAADAVVRSRLRHRHRRPISNRLPGTRSDRLQNFQTRQALRIFPRVPAGSIFSAASRSRPALSWHSSAASVSSLPQVLPTLPVHLHGGNKDSLPEHMEGREPLPRPFPWFPLVRRLLFPHFESGKFRESMGISTSGWELLVGRSEVPSIPLLVDADVDDDRRSISTGDQLGVSAPA